MNIPNLSSLKGAFNMGKAVLSAHRPEILLATSVVSGIASTILGAKGGYEARGLVDEEIRRRDEANEQEPSLTFKEKADLTWKCYVPAGVALVGSVGSTTGLHFVHVKEKKALVTAGALALEEAREKFKTWEKENTIGAMSNEEKQKILDDRAENTPIEGERRSSHIENSDGEIEEKYLVRDAYSGRDIWANKHQIEDALIDMNNILVAGDGVDLNYFYSYAGFSGLPHGAQIGWNGGELISLEWGETVRDDGRPVRTFTFLPQPSTSDRPS